MAEVTKPIALDESFNTTEQTPRNLADVIAEGIGDLVSAISQIAPQTTYDELDKLNDVQITNVSNGQVLKWNGSKWVNANESGGSGGHTIEDSTGTALTQRTNLQFKDLSVTDDSVNDATVVSASGKADKTDLTSISQTGSTATQTIPSGTYFYLNGSLVRAKTDIASGATFFSGTNYETVPKGGLNEIKSTTLTATIGAVDAGKAYFKYDFNYTEILSLSVLMPNNAQNFQWFLTEDAPTGYDLTLRFSSSGAVGIAKLLVMYR